MPEEGGWPPRISPFHVVVALIVASAAFIGYFIATLPAPPSIEARVAQEGDRVEVDYIGFFEDGRVFDTSLEEVAKDNATYPKAVSFRFKRFYSPLRFTIGAPEREVIEGFEEGVLGMRVGETRVIEIPPEKGYGFPDPSKVIVRPLVEELPQIQTLLSSDFEDQFGQQPEIGMIVQDPVWGWDVAVLSVSGSFVTIMHLPVQGSIVRPYDSWDAKVVEVDTSANGGEGLIAVRHLLGPEDVDNILAEDDQGRFRVVAVDLVAETFTVDYNEEVVGKTLFFEVTLLEISGA